MAEKPVKRHLWICPSCGRKYRLPASARILPKACPNCTTEAKSDQAERPTTFPAIDTSAQPPQIPSPAENHLSIGLVLGGVGIALVLVVSIVVAVVISNEKSSKSSDTAGSSSKRERSENAVTDTNVNRKKEAAPRKPSAAEVYARAVKSVVIIRSIRSADGKRDGLGSGFILAPDNVIITNEHVIRGASSLEIRTKDGRKAIIRAVLAVDTNRDVAVLPIPIQLRGIAELPGLRVAKTLPPIGEEVYSIGAPQGLTFSVSKGIVSQVRKNSLGTGKLVQTDASISPGSSGGPLLDKRGEVVGVNRMSRTGGQNLNFAVAATEIDSLRPFTRRQQLTDLEGYKRKSVLEALANAARKSREGTNRKPDDSLTASEIQKLKTKTRRLWDAENRGDPDTLLSISFYNGNDFRITKLVIRVIGTDRSNNAVVDRKYRILPAFDGGVYNDRIKSYGMLKTSVFLGYQIPPNAKVKWTIISASRMK